MHSSSNCPTFLVYYYSNRSSVDMCHYLIHQRKITAGNIHWLVESAVIVTTDRSAEDIPAGNLYWLVRSAAMTIFSTAWNHQAYVLSLYQARTELIPYLGMQAIGIQCSHRRGLPRTLCTASKSMGQPVGHSRPSHNVPGHLHILVGSLCLMP
jgi:hypothetical protein